eukprot:TRINITY_DN1598_c0_g1_i1.p1 TRINITY_DN1598_c0_g1~~TRINITY_DN1598_c0_g1_i1.p1  ORF type:complete len:869 (-),score=193.42 TRINITY_DN1598_c0_g1_i1:1-2607(-)
MEDDDAGKSLLDTAKVAFKASSGLPPSEPSYPEQYASPALMRASRRGSSDMARSGEAFNKVASPLSQSTKLVVPESPPAPSMIIPNTPETTLHDGDIHLDTQELLSLEGPPPAPSRPSFTSTSFPPPPPPPPLQQRLKRLLYHVIPILSWLPMYRKSFIKGDVSAGVTIGVMLIPQSMAYALVAGLPAIYGLYSSIFPVIIYAIFGSSRHLSVGPFAVISLLVAQSVTATLGSEATNQSVYVSTAITLAFLCGIIKFIFGVLRFGFLVNFLSDPVRSGFNSASAFVIGISQLRHWFGIEHVAPRRTTVYESVEDIFRFFKFINIWSFLIGIAGLGILYGIKKINRKYKIQIPGALVIVVLGTLLSWAADLEGRSGMAVVGSVPGGFPAPRLPGVEGQSLFATLKSLLPSALIIVVVGFISSVAIGTKFAEMHHYHVDPNQEFISLGLADFIGSLFSSFPGSASLSRTAVNVQAGANTQLSSLIATTIIIACVSFLTRPVYFIPQTLLASIVLIAVIDMVEWREAITLWKMQKRDFALWMTAFAGTLIIGILQGIVLGVGASLAVIIYRAAYPPFAILGRLPYSNTYINIKRFPQAITVRGLAIVRIDGSLYFANTGFMKTKMKQFRTRRRRVVGEAAGPDGFRSLLDEDDERAGAGQPEGEPYKAVVLDCSSINDIDSTAIRALKTMVDDMKNEGLLMFFACVKGPVRDSLRRSGVVSAFGHDKFFWRVHDAVDYYYRVILNEIPPDDEEEYPSRNSSIQEYTAPSPSPSPLSSPTPFPQSGAPVVPAVGSLVDASMPEYSPMIFDNGEVQQNSPLVRINMHMRLPSFSHLLPLSLSDHPPQQPPTIPPPHNTDSHAHRNDVELRTIK